MTKNNVAPFPNLKDDWETRATEAGFPIPPKFPGIEIVGFELYDVKELIDNQDKLQFDPRISGTDQEHVDALARSIEFRGYVGKPQYVTKIDRTGEMAPLRHHILMAIDKLGWKKVPCFVVQPKPYYDKKGRVHQCEEILKDFTGDEPGALNDHAVARHLETKDRIRTLNEKAKYGEFGFPTDEKEYKKLVTNFANARWGNLDKKTRGKIIEGHLKGVMPRKVERFDAKSMKERFSELPSQSKWDYDSNTLEVMCHSTAILSSLGSWMSALNKGYEEATTKGNAKEEVSKKLNTVKVRLWSYVNIGTGKDAGGINEARDKALSQIRMINTSPAFPFLIQEVKWAPQILEPTKKKETAWSVYIWNKKAETF